MTDAALLHKLQALPPDKRQSVADYIDFLLQQHTSRAPAAGSFYGLWADLDVDVAAEDVDVARRTLWKDFPRRDLP